MRDRTGASAAGLGVDCGVGTRCSALAATQPKGDIVGGSVPPAARLARPIRAGCRADFSGACAKTLWHGSTALGEPAEFDADHASPSSDTSTRHRHAVGTLRFGGACRCRHHGIAVGGRRQCGADRCHGGVRCPRRASAPHSADSRSALPAAARRWLCFDGQDDSPPGEPIGPAPPGEPIGPAPAGEAIAPAPHGQRADAAAQVYSTVARLGGVAQLVERFGRIEEARGSIPLTSTDVPSPRICTPREPEPATAAAATSRRRRTRAAPLASADGEAPTVRHAHDGAGLVFRRLLRMRPLEAGQVQAAVYPRRPWSLPCRTSASRCTLGA